MATRRQPFLKQQDVTQPQTWDIDLKKIPSAMRPVVRSSPEWQDASKSVSAKRKRPLFESNEDEEDDDEDLKLSKTKSERKRCELDGEKEPVVSETKRCHTAADVGQSQLPSQPNSVNDGSAVPKSACKKFVLLSPAVSPRVEKVVLEDLKEEASTALTQCQSVSACDPMGTMEGIMTAAVRAMVPATV